MGVSNWATIWFDDNYNIVDNQTGTLELDEYVIKLRGNEVRVFKRGSESQEFGMIGGYVYLHDFCITSEIEDTTDQVVILRCFSGNKMRIYYGISSYRYFKSSSYNNDSKTSYGDCGIKRPLVEKLILLDVRMSGSESTLRRDGILEMFKRYRIHNEYTDEPIWG